MSPQRRATAGGGAGRPGRGLGLVLALIALAALGAFAAAWATLGEVPDTWIHLSINGREIHLSPEGALPPAHAVVLAGLGALLGLATLVALLLLVPMVLGLVAGALVAALFMGVGLPLLLAVLLGGLVVSPVLLLGWLLWRALRPPRSIGA